MNARLLATTAFATMLMLAAPSSANDSSAAIGLGGLELTQNSAISMDSEDLYISREKVTVKYRFTNTSAKDVETLVSFPLPPLPTGVGGYLGDMSFPDWKALQFKTLVDGKPAQLDLREEVSLVGRPEVKNVEKRIAALGWPLRFWDDQKMFDIIDAMPAAERKKYLAEGLLRIPEYDGEAVEPNWQVTTYVNRKQIFPAGKTISVEHSYVPVAGGSVGGMLSPQSRKNNEYFREYQKRYCVDKSFLSAFDKRDAAQQKLFRKKGNQYGLSYTEVWLDYVLSSGANWKGPIKDFRLVVDKGRADSLVSFCMTGVKKIGPTQFEVRKSNFEPKDDLHILIADFVDPSQY